MSNYWKNIGHGITSMFRGLKLTFSHFRHANKRRKPIGIENDNYFDQQNGLVTLTYPHEVIPVPDHGRYRLDNAIDDCIVCDLCAKICPVNCIDIEAIKSPEEIGKTSDGSSKRLYAGVFDIDMAKCCFCGLCTTVCPTESLTMTKTYDFSEFDVLNMNYHYSDLSPEDAKEKQAIYDESQRIKAELKKQKDAEAQAAKEEKESTTDNSPIVPKPKIASMPVIKPAIPKTEDAKPEEQTDPKSDTPKPKIKPIIRPAAPKPTENKTESSEEDKKPAAPKPAFKPIIKPVIKKTETDSKLENVKSKETDSEKKPAQKPVIKPIIRPVIKKEEPNPELENKAEQEQQDEPKINPVIKPIIRPVAKKPEDETPKETDSETEKPKQPIKPVIRPVIKPKKDDNEQAE